MLAYALVGSVLLDCGRTNLIGSRDSTTDASDAPDATSTRTPSVLDAADQGSDDVADGSEATDGAGCSIPPQAHSSNPDGPGGCIPATDWTSSLWCTSSQYELRCFGTTMGGAPSPDTSLKCTPQPALDPAGGVYYCCPCAGGARGCVDVDISTYDRSCTKDSDCVAVHSGMMCPGECFCCGGNAAINVDGEARYNRTIAPVLPLLNNTCACANCPASAGPRCMHGVCALGQ